MAADGRVPIVESARAGYAFMRASLRTVAPAAVGAAAISALAQAMPPNGAAILEMASLAVSVMFSAFVLRLALNGDSSGFYGLKAGRAEANLFGALIWVGFFFFIIAMVGLFILSIGLVTAAKGAGVDLENYSADPKAMGEEAVKIIAATPFLWLLAAVEFAMLAWLSARLALVSAATIGEGRIMGFSTWSWTKDNALRILGSIALVTLPLSFALGLIVNVVAAVFNVEDLAAAPVMARGVIGLITGLGQYLILIPAANGLFVHLYRGLRPPNLPQPEKAS